MQSIIKVPTIPVDVFPLPIPGTTSVENSATPIGRNAGCIIAFLATNWETLESMLLQRFIQQQEQRQGMETRREQTALPLPTPSSSPTRLLRSLLVLLSLLLTVFSCRRSARPCECVMASLKSFFCTTICNIVVLLPRVVL